MKIIISPSKTMKPMKTSIHTEEILFVKENQYLKDILLQYNDEEIMNLMKINSKQAFKVMDYYQIEERYPALFLYSGTVFKQLDFNQYKREEYDYLSSYLSILSAYYGVLHYNSAITPYRLDMTMKPNHINLYDYWFLPIRSYFKDEDFIISLASKEFSNMIKHPHLIYIDFITIKNNKIQRNSMNVKKARGQMLNQMILNKIKTIKELKTITFDNYHYDEKMSTTHQLVFKKEEISI